MVDDINLERVQKILSNTGYCSRREAEQLIKEGRIQVNGTTITLGDQATIKDTITIDGRDLKKESPVYLVFHKPTGCVTALTDPQYRTIMHYIKCKERVFPVGRLDMNTSGLLILTNDGTFSNNITHPSYEITKTYIAELDAPIGPKKMAMIEEGIDLVDGKTSPAKVRRIHPEKIEITIHEGKNRIVRRMLEALGYKVLKLHRTKIGLLDIGMLKEGKYKRYNELPEELVKSIELAQEQAKKNPIKVVRIAPKKQSFPHDKRERTKVAIPEVLIKKFGFKEGQMPKSSLPRTRPHKTNMTPNPTKRVNGVREYVPQAPGTRRPARKTAFRRDGQESSGRREGYSPKQSYNRRSSEDGSSNRPSLYGREKKPYARSDADDRSRKPFVKRSFDSGDDRSRKPFVKRSFDSGDKPRYATNKKPYARNNTTQREGSSQRSSYGSYDKRPARSNDSPQRRSNTSGYKDSSDRRPSGFSKNKRDDTRDKKPSYKKSYDDEGSARRSYKQVTDDFFGKEDRAKNDKKEKKSSYKGERRPVRKPSSARKKY